MDKNKTQWKIRCPACGGRFYYQGVNDTFRSGVTGMSKRVSSLIQCPKCLACFTDIILHSWVDSSKNYGVIIEGD